MRIIAVMMELDDKEWFLQALAGYRDGQAKAGPSVEVILSSLTAAAAIDPRRQTQKTSIYTS